MKTSDTKSILLQEKGIALLLVLFIITLLSAMVVSFTDTTQKQLQVSQNYRASLQAYWTAQSAIQLMAAAISIDSKMNKTYDGIDNSPWHNESPFFLQTVLPLLATPLGGNSHVELPKDPLSPDHSARAIVDENRKLSLGVTGGAGSTVPGGGSAAGTGLIKNWGQSTEQTNDEQRARLERLLEKVLPENPMECEKPGGRPPGPISLDRAGKLAGHILDWIDTSNNQGVNPDLSEEACPDDGLPYLAKNAPMDSIEELSLICGFRTMPRCTILKLAEHLTVYPLITNINTATEEVLYALIAAKGGVTGADDAKKIYEKLHITAKEDPEAVVKNSGDYQRVLVGLDPTIISELSSKTGVKSSIFQVDVYGVTIDPESGKEQARSRVRMIFERTGGGAQLGQGSFQPLYYRED